MLSGGGRTEKRIAEIMKELSERIDYLRQQTDFTEALFKSISGYAVVAANFDGEIITYNIGAEQIYGYPVEKIISESTNIDMLFPKDFVEAGGLQHIIDNIMSKGMYQYEGEKVRKNGERFPAKIVLSLVKTNDGKMIGFVEIVEDLTERKKWEDEIKKLNEELEQKVVERTKGLEMANEKLKQHIEDLELFKKATIQRELRMKDLRDRIEELEKGKGKK